MIQDYFVSIVIPTKNEEEVIGRCLTTIQNLKTPKDEYEVIVVDSNSSDRTVTIAKEFNIEVLEIDNKKSTVSASRNLGAKRAKGKILAFLDADCIVSEDWLNNSLKHFKNSEASLVGYKYRIPENSSRAARAWDLIFSDRERKGKNKWVPAGNMFVSRDSFESIGGFDENLVTSEDVDFCQRLRERGFRIVTDPKIIVTHLGTPQTYYQLYRKEVWHGIGALQTFLSDLTRVRNLRPVLYAVFFAFCLVGVLISLGFSVLTQNVVALSLLTFFLILLLTVPFALSLQVMKRANNHNLFINISMVYLTYGIARAICLLSYLRKKGA
jgi:GT2 family glycosyltransferase